MNREYNSRVSAKNSERLLKNLKNTTGDYFFLPHPVHMPIKVKVKDDIALHGNPITEPRDVTCHLTQVNAPRLTPAT